jgi:hypothetical protein
MAPATQLKPRKCQTLIPDPLLPNWAWLDGYTCVVSFTSLAARVLPHLLALEDAGPKLWFADILGRSHRLPL